MEPTILLLKKSKVIFESEKKKNLELQDSGLEQHEYSHYSSDMIQSCNFSGQRKMRNVSFLQNTSSEISHSKEKVKRRIKER